MHLCRRVISNIDTTIMGVYMSLVLPPLISMMRLILDLLPLLSQTKISSLAPRNVEFTMGTLVILLLDIYHVIWSVFILLSCTISEYGSSSIYKSSSYPWLHTHSYYYKTLHNIKTLFLLKGWPNTMVMVILTTMLENNHTATIH